MERSCGLAAVPERKASCSDEGDEESIVNASLDRVAALAAAGRSEGRDDVVDAMSE